MIPYKIRFDSLISSRPFHLLPSSRSGSLPSIVPDRVVFTIPKHARAAVSEVLYRLYGHNFKVIDENETLFMCRGACQIKYNRNLTKHWARVEIYKAYEDMQALSNLVALMGAIGVKGISKLEVNLLVKGNSEKIKKQMYINCAKNMYIDGAYVYMNIPNAPAWKREQLTAFLRVYDIGEGVCKIELQLKAWKNVMLPAIGLLCSDLLKIFMSRVSVIDVSDEAWKFVEGHEFRLVGKTWYEVLKIVRNKVGVRRVNKYVKSRNLFEYFGEPEFWRLPKPQVDFDVDVDKKVLKVYVNDKLVCVLSYFDSKLHNERLKYAKEFKEKYMKIFEDKECDKERGLSHACSVIIHDKKLDSRSRKLVRKIENIAAKAKKLGKKLPKVLQKEFEGYNLAWVPLLMPAILHTMNLLY